MLPWVDITFLLTVLFAEWPGRGTNGLVLLVPPESQYKISPNATEVLSLDLDEDLDVSQNWTQLPASLMERGQTPFEWNDVTLEDDVLPHGHRHRHRGRPRKRFHSRRRSRRSIGWSDSHEFVNSVETPQRTGDDSSLDLKVEENAFKEDQRFSMLQGFLDSKAVEQFAIPADRNDISNLLDSSQSSYSPGNDAGRNRIGFDATLTHSKNSSSNIAAVKPESSTKNISSSSSAAATSSALSSSESPDSSSSATAITTAGTVTFPGSKSSQNADLMRQHNIPHGQEVEHSERIISGGFISPINMTTKTTANDEHRDSLVRAKRWARRRSNVDQYDRYRSAGWNPRARQAMPRARAIIRRAPHRIEARVGVLVVVENSIYRQYMQDNGHNKRMALARIRKYYGMVFSMMDQRFGTIKDPLLSISVKISGILVAESREDSAWLEQIVDWGTKSTHGRASVHTDRALRRFSKWVSNYSGLPEYDHAMVFTGYRLSSKQGVGLGGMAYLRAICDTSSGNAVSIVGDRGDFQSVKVATHELAHSLGASHDGYRSATACHPDSNYIMTPHGSHQKEVLKNAYYFSRCSIRDMYEHLRKPTSACVRNDPQVYHSYDLERLPPGRLYSADMQCKLIFGKKSRFCHVSPREGDLREIMCGLLWCKDPDKENSCRTNSYLSALPGTECSPYKMCHLGECKPDPSKIGIMIRPSYRTSRTRTSPRPTRPTRPPPRTRPPSPQRNSIPSNPQEPAKPSYRMRGPRKRGSNSQRRRSRPRSRPGRRRRGRRRRRNRPRCSADKNPRYCHGLIQLNPGGCRRRAIRQYCCVTCRHLRRKRRRRKR